MSARRLAACLLAPLIALLVVLPASAASAAPTPSPSPTKSASGGGMMCAPGGVCMPAPVTSKKPTSTASPSKGSGTDGSCGIQPGTPACIPAPGAVVSGVLDSVVLGPLATDLGGAVTTVFEWLLTWWLSISPISSIEGTNALLIAPIATGIGMLIAILLMMFQGIKTVISRKGTPLMEAFEGLFKFAVMNALAAGLIDSLLAASNALTNDIYQAAFKNKSTKAEADQMVASLLASGGGVGDALLIIIALVVLVVGLVQAGMLYVRMASLPLQALAVPIAAAGQVGSGSTRQWQPKLWAGIFATLCYKPVAMAILGVGFDESTGAKSLSGVVIGLITLVLSIFAMPSLTRIFAPITGAMAGGGGSTLLSVAGEAMMMRGMAGRGGGGGGGGGGAANPAADALNAAGGGGGGAAGGGVGAAGAVGGGGAGGGGAAAGAAAKGGFGAAVGGPLAAVVVGLKAAEAAIQKGAGTMAGGGQ
jgi:hypothetical protein